MIIIILIKMNVTGFPVRLQIYDDFLKGATKK